MLHIETREQVLDPRVVPQETFAPLTRFWGLNPTYIAANALSSLWKERGLGDTPILFQVKRNEHLYHPELLEKVIQTTKRYKTPRAGHLLCWERLNAPLTAGEIGTMARPRADVSVKYAPACIAL